MIAVKKNILKASVAVVVALVACTTVINAQCATFTEAPDAYVIYRGDVKAKNFDGAYEFWKTTYDATPAADGKRWSVWIDGIEIYKHKLKTATGADADAAKAMIVKLYDEAMECIANKGVVLKNCSEQKCIDEKIGFLAGRKAFDMLYTTQSSYVDLFKALNMAVDKGGNSAEYIVLEPMAYAAVNQFAEKNIDKAQTRAIYDRMNAIADHNIANNAQFKTYYQDAKTRMNAKFDEIADNIFDCEYWKVKIKPQYDANPNDPENLKQLISKLKRQACQKGDPLLDEMERKYSQYASAENAKRQATFEANNPGMLAKKAYDAGDFNGAIMKYQEAISSASDPVKKGKYYLSIASIHKKQKAYGKAREAYQQAAAARPGWGAPYISIGDMYARASRNCGSDGYSRGLAVLAAINMYRKAKNTDPNMASDASARISKYRASIPTQEDVFMRGKKKGDRVSVPCWIGGSVPLDYN